MSGTLKKLRSKFGFMMPDGVKATLLATFEEYKSMAMSYRGKHIALHPDDLPWCLRKFAVTASIDVSASDPVTALKKLAGRHPPENDYLDSSQYQNVDGGHGFNLRVL